MAIDLDGRVVVAGAATVANSNQDFALARYLLQNAQDFAVGETP
jgi:Domain of unknown function (DUF5122) beta-propeller